jgi:hypothetical protein
MNIENALRQIYNDGDYDSLVKAIAVIESESYKEFHCIKEALDSDQTQEIADDFAQSVLNKLNELEGNK